MRAGAYRPRHDVDPNSSAPLLTHSCCCVPKSWRHGNYCNVRFDEVNNLDIDFFHSRYYHYYSFQYKFLSSFVWIFYYLKWKRVYQATIFRSQLL